MNKHMFNRYRHIGLVVILTLVCLAGSDPGMTLKAQSQIKDLGFMDPNQSKVSFKFKFINNLIIVPVIINDSDTMHFILDTGLSTSIMTEISMGDSLSLNYTRQVKLNGLGQGDPVDALHSYGNIFYISGIRGMNQDLYILLQKNFIVGINYESKIITFHNPKKYKPSRRQKKGVTLPLTIHHTKPYLFGTIIREDGLEIPVKLLLDTGASHALWIDVESDENLELPDNAANIFLGKGLNGDIHGKIGRINKFAIGSFSFDKPIVAFPDTLSAGDALGRDNRNGSLGSELLRRFHVLIDYPNNQITLLPNSQYRSGFKLNRSGIDIEAPLPGLPFYIISNIRKGSPADKAGLRKGDEINFVNGKNVVNMNINDIYSFLQKRAGYKVRLNITREGYNFKVVLYLDDFI